MMHKLYVVGMVHDDQLGGQRLEAILERFDPDIIALEFSTEREEAALRQKTREQLRQEISQDLKTSGLTLTTTQYDTFLEVNTRINDMLKYEFKTSTAYIKQHPKTKLKYIDMSSRIEGVDVVKENSTTEFSRLLSQISSDPQSTREFTSRLDMGVELYMSLLQENAENEYDNASQSTELIKIMRNKELFDQLTRELPAEEIAYLKHAYNPEREEQMASNIRAIYDNKSVIVAPVGIGHMTTITELLTDINAQQLTLQEFNKYQLY